MYFFPGWLDTWGSVHSLTPSSAVAEGLEEILAMGANVNLYMMHGGTNFGFEACFLGF